MCTVVADLSTWDHGEPPGLQGGGTQIPDFPHQGIQNVPMGMGRVPERVFVPVIATRGRVRVESTLVVTEVDAGLSVLELSTLSYYNRDEPLTSAPRCRKSYGMWRKNRWRGIL